MALPNLFRRVKLKVCMTLELRRRSMGFAAASFEIGDRPIFEDFMGGIGFAYAISLAARLHSIVTWTNGSRSIKATRGIKDI